MKTYKRKRLPYPASEQKIVNLLRRGDEWAYRYLFDEHYDLLCRVAADYLKDVFLAETIVGDAIFHLWEIRESLEIHTSLRSYLLRAVRNRCLNFLEQQYVEREISLSKIGDKFFDENILTTENYPLSHLLEKELETEIKKSLHEMSNETQAVFRMSRFAGMTYQQIADKQSVSVNTVKYHLKTALAKLRHDLRHYLEIILFIFATNITNINW
jgi:RNA polymerase sigma-70 factor (ECF subfamily)